jgi:hypothetical protein
MHEMDNEKKESDKDPSSAPRKGVTTASRVDVPSGLEILSEEFEHARDLSSDRLWAQFKLRMAVENVTLQGKPVCKEIGPTNGHRVCGNCIVFDLRRQKRMTWVLWFQTIRLGRINT